MGSIEQVATCETQSGTMSLARREARDRGRIERTVRAVSIRWRIVSITLLNSALALILVATIWNGARGLADAWQDLRNARDAKEVLVSLESEAGRLQNLIHRYINQPNPEILNEIERRRQLVATKLKLQATDTVITARIIELGHLMDKFLEGFDELRSVRTAISETYETDVLKPAKEMSGLYAIIDSAARGRTSLIWPSLGQSREAFNATLLAANAYYLSLSRDAGEEARRNLLTIERTAPVMLDLADGDMERGAVAALRERAGSLLAGLDRLSGHFNTQSSLLSETIDDNASAMSIVIDKVMATMQDREQAAQARFDAELNAVYRQVAGVAAAFLAIAIMLSIWIARSISSPLQDLRLSMSAIVAGQYDETVQGLDARDEIGEMARAVEVFRGNAIARRQAEAELQVSKERAEAALSDLRDTQESLIEAEKLAALGGLVAGVAHEVNNPVGISLTVASALARRTAAFQQEIENGQLRRSRLTDFVDGNREAADQLVTNLQRAGELIQSFKQVAVDRSHADRRSFELLTTTEQIVSSLRPGLKSSHLQVTIEAPAGIMMDSYPGPYGQVLTNLVLNAATHGFDQGGSGAIQIKARQRAENEVEITVADDGRGMTEEVQRRAFDPFFTTRRGEGGTGLGLHIVYNLVTRRLGGRIKIFSAPGKGTTFRIRLPNIAPREEPASRQLIAPEAGAHG